MRAAAVVCASALSASIALPSVAKEATMRVRIGDLNLNSDAGAAKALDRIRGASTRFCRFNSGPLYRAQEARCRHEVSYKAVRQLDAPVVTALYEARTSGALLARR
nr:UrcA family protein [Phenylobacterium hankyongense]